MRTIQKRVKFSKGEINPLLSDRTDINLLDESASYIKNYIPTIYGGIKTRMGTKKITKLRQIISNIENPIIKSEIGGNVENLFNENEFISDVIGNKKILFDISATSRTNAFMRFSIYDIYLTPHINSELEIEMEEVIDENAEESKWYRLKTIRIVKAGNNYMEAPNIRFEIASSQASRNDESIEETLPQAVATIENGILKSVEIVDAGYLKSPDILIIIEQPEEFREVLNIKNGENILDSFTVGEYPINKTITLSDYQENITIERNSNNSINTQLNLNHFSFNIEKPTITTTIGGDVDNLLNNYSSDILKTSSGELLHFTFNERTNYFTINNVKLQESREAILRTRTEIPQNTIYFGISLTNIFIDDAGLGYSDGEVDVELIDTKYIIPWNVLPKAKAIIQNTVVKSVKIITGGVKINTLGGTPKNYLDDNINILAKLPNPNKYLLNIKLQAKNDNDEWIDISSFVIEQGINTNINTALPGDGYREFRLYRDDAEYIGTKLLISNITYGNFGGFLNRAKIIPFFYENEYILVVSKGAILIYKDDIAINTLQAVEIREDIINELKYTQIENRIILTHNSIHPLEIVLKNNNWSISKMNLNNIPFHNFSKDNEEIIKNITLTPSSTDGTAYLTSNTNFFKIDSVGQIIDGGGGRFRITEYVSNTKVYGYTIIPFYTNEAFSNFKYITGYEPVWSEARGYPNCCLYYQQRLWFGGSREKPNGLWASRVGQYNDFNNIGNYSNDGIDVDLSSKDNGAIVNLYGNRGLQIFTETAEFVASEGTLTPNDIFITQVSSVGSNKKISVSDVAGTTVFIDAKGLNLNSFIYNDSVASYNTQAITLLNNQLIKHPVELAVDYNSNFEDGNFIYILNGDGTIAIGNILLEQNINSFTRFEISGRKIINCAVLRNEVYFITQKDKEIFLEKLSHVKTDSTTEIKLLNQNRILALEDYNNQSIRVYSDKKDYGVYPVENGFITLKEVVSDDLYIGLDIDCEIVSNGISVGGQTNNIKSRIAKAVITANDTKKINFNGEISKSNTDVFNIIGISGWNIENTFKIKSVFDYLEIKSIVLYINYGR